MPELGCYNLRTANVTNQRDQHGPVAHNGNYGVQPGVTLGSRRTASGQRHRCRRRYSYGRLGVRPSSGTLTLNSDGSFSYTPNSALPHRPIRLQSGRRASRKQISRCHSERPFHQPRADGLWRFLHHASRHRAGRKCPGVLGNDTDADGDMLTSVLSRAVAWNADLQQRRMVYIRAKRELCWVGFVHV